MKKRSTIIILAALCLLFVVSCQDRADNATARLEISIEDRSIGSRTIMPSSALLEPQKYTVSGIGPYGSTFGPIVSTDSNVVVSGIMIGNWTIAAKALNVEDKELASGSDTFSVGSGQNSVTLALDRIEGTGSMRLDLSWDEDITLNDSVRMEVSIKDVDGNEILATSREASTTSEGVSILLSLAAGCHIMTVRAFDEDGSLDIGATDAIRIVAGTLSSGSVHLKPSKPNLKGDLSIGIENNIGTPMPFYIDYLPKNVSSGQTVTLRALHETLDSSIQTSSLHYSWYKDGVQMSVSDSFSCNVQAQIGLHRYDVIVTSNMDGTMCGASLLLNVAQ